MGVSSFRRATTNRRPLHAGAARLRVDNKGKVIDRAADAAVLKVDDEARLQHVARVDIAVRCHDAPRRRVLRRERAGKLRPAEKELFVLRG